jgi:hypothetical protein
MDKKNIAFIPARAGSLGIKNKNLQKVSGVSLVKRSYDHAISTELFGKIIVSTDSFEIISEITSTFLYAEFKQLSENSLVEISSNTFLHKRRIDQAESLSPIREVIFDLANNLEFDQLWMLQPTSPFRTKSDFSSIMNLQTQIQTKKEEGLIDSNGEIREMTEREKRDLSDKATTLEYVYKMFNISKERGHPNETMSKFLSEGAMEHGKVVGKVKHLKSLGSAHVDIP